MRRSFPFLCLILPAAACLLAGPTLAEEPAKSTVPETQEQPAAAGLTVAWDSQNQQMVAPSQEAMAVLAQKMQALLATESEAMRKAGLLEPFTLPNGMTAQRVAPELMNTSFVVMPLGQQVAACLQEPGQKSQVVAAPKAPTSPNSKIERPRSTPAVEGWVSQ